jgi:drug/metabolite transporter (DMT)-like permease
VLGLLGVGAFNALLYSGLRYTTATNALLLQAAIPALVVLFDRPVLRGAQLAAARPLGWCSRRSACWRSCSRATWPRR